MGHDIRNYIAGEWIEGGEKTLENTNPANTDEILGQVPLQSRETARKAIAAAAEAYPAWRRTPAPKRGAILYEALRILDGRREELAKAMTLEEGKTIADARGEVVKSMNILEFMAGEARRIRGETIPSEMPSTVCYTVRQPLGVVALITPWNFPVAIPLWKISPALVAGNTVVFKPATLTPWTAEIIVEAFVEAGVPPGVLNFVTGAGRTVGEELISHPEIEAISFTGSNEVGMHLYQVAAGGGKKVQCEMGGKNPVIVLEDGDLDLATEGICQGAFASTGQRCTATSRVVVHDAVADALTERILARAEQIVVGDGMRDDVTMGPCVDASQMETVLGLIEKAREEGNRCLLGGKRLDGPEHQKGFFVAPTVFTDVAPNDTLAQEEVFGPVLAIQRVKGFDEAIDVANNVAFGLSSSIYTRDVRHVFEYLDRIECGITHVNSPTVGGEAQAPFGGIKATGIGPREQGTTAIEFYSELKTVYVDFTGAARDSKIY